MNYLLDTHVLLWSIISTKKLSLKAKKIIQDNTNFVYTSSVSYWEISIKYSSGKLKLGNSKPDDIRRYSLLQKYQEIELTSEIAASIYKLPRFKNKDPFDRILALQVVKGDYVLISKDSGFDAYKSFGLSRVW